jgi:ABC-2 type transport system permease protein
MGVELLSYRPWRGEFRAPAAAVWPIARIALRMIFRRKLFWALYGLGLMMFLLFFFGQYLLAWAESQLDESSVQIAGGRFEPVQLVHLFRMVLKLDGRTGEMYFNFFSLQGYMVMIVLALAGSILVGNDLQYGSLPFYLSKPLSRSHYVLGKCLAVAVFVNLLTTIPAAILFVQFGLLDTWSFFFDYWRLFAGILGYGLVLTVCLSLLLVAAASWVRRTVPLIMTWTALFLFCRLLAGALVDNNRLHYDPKWRLIDLWNSMSLIGMAILDVPAGSSQPPVGWAILVLSLVCILCATYLVLRIRAVEVVQ